VTEHLVSVRYMVDDVDEAIDFYTKQFGFELGQSASPAFAEVIRGQLRLLLAGPTSSAGRAMPDGRRPQPGGWNRIHFIVADIESEVARLREVGTCFRNDIVTGPGGRQILLDDPSGNPVELFQPADTLTGSPDERRRRTNDHEHESRGKGAGRRVEPCRVMSPTIVCAHCGHPDRE
jgi:predicted enzyme related to lactoylglutathione lyase